MLFKNIYFNASYKWLDILQPTLDFYNNKIHRTIKMKPAEVSKDDEQYLLNTVYKPKKNTKKDSKFKVGDVVRVSLLHNLFTKLSTSENWSCRLFRVKSVILKNPHTYKLENLDGKPHFGTYYEQELLKTRYPEHYLVEKILKRKKGKIFVKFYNFDNSENCWIDDV
jgi:hypothetical protein